MTTAQIIATGIRGVGRSGSEMEIPSAITARRLEGVQWAAQYEDPNDKELDENLMGILCSCIEGMPTTRGYWHKLVIKNGASSWWP